MSGNNHAIWKIAAYAGISNMKAIRALATVITEFMWPIVLTTFIFLNPISLRADTTMFSVNVTTGTGFDVLNDAVNKLVIISSDTYLYGMASGMALERDDIKDLIVGLQLTDLASGTVRGLPFPTNKYLVIYSTNPLKATYMPLISTNSASDMVYLLYGYIGDHIDERTTGIRVIP